MAEVWHDDELLGRVPMRKKGQVTMPPQVRAALHVDEGDEVEFRVGADGVVFLRGMTSVPTDQRWFWGAEWQAGEREASAEIAAGGLKPYKDLDEMFEALND